MPFKQKADTTNVTFQMRHIWLFLPFKQKADATDIREALEANVVFTFQTEGRCNQAGVITNMFRLFLPFKQKADATGAAATKRRNGLFLPFKQKADATDIREALEANVVFTFQTEGRCNQAGVITNMFRLFLPFKQKADATGKFYNRRIVWLFLPFKQKVDTTEIATKNIHP